MANEDYKMAIKEVIWDIVKDIDSWEYWDGMAEELSLDNDENWDLLMDLVSKVELTINFKE
jgi:hypothetical protein